MSGLHKFRRKNFCLALGALAFSIVITWKTEARRTSASEIYSTLTTDTIPRPVKNRISPLLQKASDTIPSKDSIPLNVTRDSTNRAADSLNRTDTIPPAPKVDTFSLKLSKDTLDAPVNYEAVTMLVCWSICT